jgi:hypothetical protein
VGERELLRRYRSIDTARAGDGDPDDRAREVDELLTEIVRRHPDSPPFWYDRGMHAKWRREWRLSVQYNLRALDLLDPAERAGAAAAWNLGIAATALRAWREARLAWAAFGIELPVGPGLDTPVEADFGEAPVRLNAAPRFIGEPPVLVDGRQWDEAVVWGRRVCPARIRITSVPPPSSGHRRGDVVLHDGDTVGTERRSGTDVGIFHEIDLWERAAVPTLTVTVTAPDRGAMVELADLAERSGLALEDWSPASGDQAWTSRRAVAMAADLPRARALLDYWAGEDDARAHDDLTLALA